MASTFGSRCWPTEARVRISQSLHYDTGIVFPMLASVKINGRSRKRGPKSAWSLFNIDNDISESNDISDQHPEIVKQMVYQASEWGKSHIKPLWFYNDKAAKDWKESGMPHYESTLTVD